MNNCHNEDMNKPLLSIITINYNNAAGLRNTVESVVSQQLDDSSLVEYIVIDGKSTDDSLNIIKNAESKIKVDYSWVSEADSGIYNAMNKGIKKACGKYLYMLNSGDYLEPNALNIILKELSFEPDLLLFELNQLDTLGVTTTVLSYPVMLNYGAMRHQGMIYKKSFHDEYGLYSEEYRFASDYDFCIKAFLNKDIKIRTIFFPCANFVLGGVGDSKKSIQEFNQIQKKYGLHNFKHYSTLRKVIKMFLPYGIIVLYNKIKR